jgi:hypothetical protein
MIEIPDYIEKAEVTRYDYQITSIPSVWCLYTVPLPAGEVLTR